MFQDLKSQLESKYTFLSFVYYIPSNYTSIEEILPCSCMELLVKAAK